MVCTRALSRATNSKLHTCLHYGILENELCVEGCIVPTLFSCFFCCSAITTSCYIFNVFLLLVITWFNIFFFTCYMFNASQDKSSVQGVGPLADRCQAEGSNKSHMEMGSRVCQQGLPFQNGRMSCSQGLLQFTAHTQS